MQGSIQKKNGRYYLVYYLPNGKQKWEKSGTNKKEAERLLVSRVNQINRGEYVELKEIDFAGFSERWFREYADGAVKLSTLAAYRSVVKNHLTPYFADVRLTGVSLEYVQGYVTEKREAGYAPKTLRNHIVILKEMFKHAVRWGYLRFNPALEVDLPRIPHREMDFLIPDEIRLFLETAKKVQPDHYVLFLTAVMTGMRRGELLAMKWRNVDWQRRQYFVKEAYYRGRFDQPKSERSMRPIDLTKTVCERLMDLYEAQKGYKKEGAIQR